MEGIQQFLQSVISSFNPSEVFSSISNFVGSGYIFLIIAAAIVYGIVAKIVKVIVVCIIAFIIWYLFSSGYVDLWLAEVLSFAHNVINGIH